MTKEVKSSLRAVRQKPEHKKPSRIKTYYRENYTGSKQNSN